MKKTCIILMTGLLLCFFYAQANIKESSSYFLGSWKVIVIGTPNGDATLIVHLKQEEGKLTGYIDTDDQSIPTIQISKVEEQDNSVIIYYTASGMMFICQW